MNEELHPISHTREVIDALADIETRELKENNRRFMVLVGATAISILLIVIICILPEDIQQLLLNDNVAFFYSDKIVGTYLGVVFGFLLTSVGGDFISAVKSQLYAAYSKGLAEKPERKLPQSNDLDDKQVQEMFNELINKRL